MQIKKLLGSVLALALLVSVSQANAEVLKNFKFGGSVEVSAISARHVTNFQKAPAANMGGGVTTDRVGTGQTRIMLGMDWDLLDDVHAKITLGKNDRVYGAAGVAHSGSDDLNTVQTNVYIDEGYFKIDKVFGLLDMTFGRQFFGEKGDLIAYYGVRDSWGLPISAIDGARFDYVGEKMYLTGVAFEPSTNNQALGLENNTAGIQTDVRGFIVGNKGHENIDAKVYVWNAMTHGNTNNFGANADAKNSNLYIAGFKVKAKFGGVYASAEFAQNLGQDRTTGGIPTSYAGRAFLVNGGMKADVEQIGTFNPWAEFGLGTGRGNTGYGKNENFMAIATDYRPGAIYGRFDQTATAAGQFGTNVNANLAGNGLQNRVIFGGGVKVTPTALNKLTAGVAFYDFRFQRLAYPHTAAQFGNKHIGSEIDVTAEWKHSENVSLTGSVANFQPGGFIKNIVNGAGGNTPATVTKTTSAYLAALDVAVKF